MKFMEKWPASLILAAVFNLLQLVHVYWVGASLRLTIARAALPVFCLIGILGRRPWARKICLVQYFFTGIVYAGVVWSLGIPYQAMSVEKMAAISSAIVLVFFGLFLGLKRSSAARSFPHNTIENRGTEN